jgi:hypothetical protein
MFGWGITTMCLQYGSVRWDRENYSVPTSGNLSQAVLCGRGSLGASNRCSTRLACMGLEGLQPVVIQTSNLGTPFLKRAVMAPPQTSLQKPPYPIWVGRKPPLISGSHGLSFPAIYFMYAELETSFCWSFVLRSLGGWSAMEMHLRVHSKPFLVYQRPV